VTSADLQYLFGIQRSEPDCMTRLVSEHDQPHIRSPRETAAPISRLRRSGLRKTRPFLKTGFLGHVRMRFVHLDPPGLIKSWKIYGFGQRLSSGTFHHGSLDDNACGHIFPERYEQLARQRHDCRLLKTAAIAPDPFFKPQGQRRLRLMAQP
jgi:hypothetical protein